MTTSQPASAADGFAEFVRWTIEQLGYPHTEQAGHVRVELPEDVRGNFDGRAALEFRLANSAEKLAGENGLASEAESSLTLDSPLLVGLLEQLHAQGSFLHSQPRAQPKSIHEIAQRLFPAYSVLDGHMHMGGCSLEDRPFVRLTYATPSTSCETAHAPSERATLCHYYFDREGAPVAQEQVAALSMAELVPASTAIPKLAAGELDRMVTLARQHVERSAHDSTSETVESSSAKGSFGQAVPAIDPSRGELLAVTIIWCKYASGKLTATIGEGHAEFAFSGWANSLEPVPLACPVTGEATHALAATQRGMIVAASQIARCAETGRRELRRELGTCSVTGKLALPDQMATCPVCEEPVLKSVLMECPVCRQQVSPDVLTRGICRACAAPPAVLKTDARLARLLGEFPRLDEWRRWKLSETATVYIAIARSIMKRLLVVVDKHSLEVLQISTAGALSRAWQPVPPEQWEGYLR